MGKKKKEKITYIDDGSSFADMSALDRAKKRGNSNAGKPTGSSGSQQKKSNTRQRATFKEQFHTYIESVKLMIIPMLITIGIICLAFLIVYFLL